MKSIIRSVEFDLIKSDIDFYLALVLPLAERQSSSIIFPALIPYLSLFTVETYKYLQQVLPYYAHSLSIKYSGIIDASRMRVKFFDDTEKRISGMFELLSWVSEFHSEWHVNRHKGIFAPLKRIPQDDLGIFAYNGHVIGSTHTGLLNLGYEKEDLPTTSKEISAVIGPLTGSVAESLGNYLRNPVESVH